MNRLNRFISTPAGIATNNRNESFILLSFLLFQALFVVLSAYYPKIYLIALGLMFFLAFIFIVASYMFYAFIILIVVTIISNHYFPFFKINVLRERNILLIIMLLFFIWHSILYNRPLKKGIFSKHIGLIFLVLLIGALYGIIRGNSRYLIALEFEWYFYLVIYFVVVTLIDSYDKIIVVVKTVIVTTVIMAIITLFIFSYILFFQKIIFYKNCLGHIFYLQSGIPRVISNAEMFFPIVFCTQLSLLLFSPRRGKNFYSSILTLVLLFFAMIVSLTRGMWFATIASSSVVVLLYLYHKGSNTFFSGVKRVFAGLLFVAVIIFVLMHNPATQNFIIYVSERFSSLLSLSVDLSLFNRYQEFIQVVKALRSNPFIGQGLGSEIYWRDILFSFIVHKTNYVHNSYLWILLKFGFIGFLTLCIVYLSIIRSLFQIIRRIRLVQLKAIATGLSAGLISVFIFSITSPFINIGIGNFYLALVLGIFSLFSELSI